MARILIAHASSHGHTATIAARLADQLRLHDIEVEQLDLLGDLPERPLDRYDGTILAASIHRGTHQPEAIEWARGHRGALASGASGFISVSLTAAEATDETRAQAERWLDDFAAGTGWQPDTTLSLAGALEYREYGFATRILMKLLMRRGGHPTDTSRDYDYTDWDAVDRFADKFCALLTVSGASR